MQLMGPIFSTECSVSFSLEHKEVRVVIDDIEIADDDEMIMGSFGNYNQLYDSL